MRNVGYITDGRRQDGESEKTLDSQGLPFWRLSFNYRAWY